MPRPKLEINPICGKRLKQVCQEQGITQKQLSKKIHLSEQGISAIVQGNARLTGDMANRVIEVFPQYRVEWLLGYDDMPTEEYVQSYKRAMQIRDRLMDEAHNRTILENFENILETEELYSDGSVIKIKKPLNNNNIPQLFKQGLISEEDFEQYTQGKGKTEAIQKLLDEHSDYIITIDGDSFHIPVRDFFLLADDVEQYAIYRIKEYIKNKKRRYY